MALLSFIPPSQQQEGTLYWTFSSLIIVFLIYSVPVFLIGGALFSISIDSLMKNIHYTNIFTKLLALTFVYLIGGIVVNTLFLLIISEGKLFNHFDENIKFYQ